MQIKLFFSITSALAFLCQSLFNSSLLAAEPQNLGSEAGETTTNSDTRADYLLGRDDDFKNKEYYDAMDKLGPEAVTILIRRYQEVPDKAVLNRFKRDVAVACMDAALHYEADHVHPLGAVRRDQALRFFVGLLSSSNDACKAIGVKAIEKFVEEYNASEPFVIEGVINFLDRGNTFDISSFNVAYKVAGMLGHDEVTAQRLESIINRRVLPLASRDDIDAQELEVARQAVKEIRQRANR